MGREVRIVPPNWQHPSEGTYSDGSTRFISLLSGSYTEALADWELEKAKWDDGFVRDYSTSGWKLRDDTHTSFDEWHGGRPLEESYMPAWTSEEATHLMMYETTSEGSPISPAFKTPEELARWLADNNASAFAGDTASYESWLDTIKRGWAPSAIIGGGVMRSGVEAMSDDLVRPDS